MTRNTVKAGDDWEVSIANPYPQVVRCNGSVYTRGQCAFDRAGNVLAPNDFAAQIRLAIEFGRNSLAEINIGLKDLTRVVVYFDARLGCRDEDIAAMVERNLGLQDPPPLVLVPLHGFAELGMVQEIDMYASTDAGRQHVAAPAGSAGSCAAVRAGDMIYLSRLTSGEGDLQTQLRTLERHLADRLAPFGADIDDVVKLKTYYRGGDSADEWKRLVELRSRWFKRQFPVVTDIPLTNLAPHAGIAIDAIAMRAAHSERGAREPIDAAGIGGFPFDCPHPPALRSADHLFIGGRMALDSRGQVIEPTGAEYQTRCCMTDIQTLLAAAGLGAQDVVKQNTYFRGRRDSKSDLLRNFPIRASFYRRPGPASTGVAVERLPLLGAMLSIEATAMRSR